MVWFNQAFAPVIGHAVARASPLTFNELGRKG